MSVQILAMDMIMKKAHHLCSATTALLVFGHHQQDVKKKLVCLNVLIHA